MKRVVGELHKVIEQISGQTLSAQDWAPVPDPSLGDVSIPCFKIAKALAKNPAQVAADLAPQLEAHFLSTPHSLVKKVVQKGPYLNFFSSTENLFASIHKDVSTKAGPFGGSTRGQGKRLVIDFSSPNIAKEIALHHLRSTAIGNSLARIASAHSFDVKRINYLGDWGTTHGKLILGLRKFGTEQELERGGLAYMLDLYVRFNKAEAADPTLSDEAKAAFKKLESGDAEYRRIWKLFRDISIREFKKLYERLGIDFDFYDGESLYEQRLDDAVNEVREKLGTRISDGAEVCDLKGFNIPILLRKDDGASLYITRDICAAADRFERFQYDHSWYVVAVQQKLHFQQLFGLLTALGKSYAPRCEHIWFGMLSFGSKTMKSREGNVIFLNDVLDEAKNRALAIIREKNPELSSAEEVAEMIGCGALIFFDLSQHRNHDVAFDWEKALSFDGDTAPFIQYTHARCNSLVQRAQEHLASLKPLSNTDGLHALYNEASLRKLVNEWASFESLCDRAFNDRDPSQVATGLLNIARAFNHLYHQIRFKDEQDHARLGLLISVTETTAAILKQGLWMLGIRAPQEM